MNGASAPSPLISIVIVNYNGAAVLGDCLRSVLAQPYRPIEIVVVDNASDDGSVALAKEICPPVRVIANSVNNGFAEGNNQGVAVSTGEYVVLLNNDTTVERDWLTGLLDFIRQPGMGVVTSRVVTDGVPGAFYEMNGTINYLGYNVMREFTDLSRVFFAGGASVIFRRATVGMPFLSEFFLYHEDAYLSWKMMLAGYRIGMAQSSVVLHRGSVSVRRQPSRLVTFYQERNRILNCLFFYERRTLLRLLPYFAADAVAKLLLSLLAGRKSFLGILRSYGWILGHIGWIRRERRKRQTERTVPDQRILELMSHKVVDAQGSIASLLNRMSRLYADCTGLRYHA